MVRGDEEDSSALSQLMHLLRYIRSLPEHLRFRFGPKLANWVVHLSTHRARQKLSDALPIRVLVDNTVRSLAVTHETGWISTGTKMWGGHHPVETGYRARILVYSSENRTETYENVTFLAGIAHLARTGRLNLCTSAELDDERWRQPMGRFSGYGYFDHSLFGDLTFECIDNLNGSWMLSPSGPSLKDQQINRINKSDDPLFKALVHRLGEKQSFDAWHIRTAEVNSAYCFLTADFKLRRSVERWKTYEPFRSLTTRIMTPAEFGREFGLFPTHPHIHSYTGASFFVRSDLYMPGEKRRPVSHYRSNENNGAGR